MNKSFLTSFIFLLLFAFTCTSERDHSVHSESTDSVVERIRPSSNAGTTAAYFTYTNSQEIADTLLEVEADFAEVAQVHESYETEDGMMGMRERNKIVVQSGEEINFQQGGLHIMLMGLKKPLAEGDSMVVKMKFSKAGEVTKVLPVRP